MKEEGYTRLDSYELAGPKIKILNQKMTERELIDKINELKKINNNGFLQGVCEPIEFNYYLLFDERFVKYLSAKEKNNIADYEISTKITYMAPTLYRSLGSKKYVDKFFDTGELRLTTFKKCHELDNDIRRDETDGINTLTTKQGDLRFESKVGVSDNYLMLCCSLSDAPADDSPKEACIVFDDFNELISIITKKLNDIYGVSNIVFGMCNYNGKKLEGTTGVSLKDCFSDNTFDGPSLVSAFGEIGGNKILFAKDEGFKDEHEYRIVWQIKSQVKDPINIEVPELREFVSRLED